MSEERELYNIVVTGFGPFNGHDINASWEAVKLLPDKFENYRILKEEIPVCYSSVEERIPILWDTFEPKLVVHVGVKGGSQELTIEQKAYREGYHNTDASGTKHPSGHYCPPEVGDESITTGINVLEMCEHLNKFKKDMFCTSENAGRFLCEYIYYSSLMKDKNRCLFVHVPPLDSPYSAEEISEGLLEIIKCSLNKSCT